MTGERERTPRWVKVFGVVALVVAVLFVVLVLTGRGGGHGPGRHAPRGDTTGGHKPPSAVTTGGHTPPSGVTHP